MTPVLEVRDVTVRRDQKLILGGLNWKVEAGQHWVVLGPNGAGKSTLMKLVSARTHATSGTVNILGRRMGRTDVFTLRPRIGLLSAALAGLIPPQELVRDVVVTAARSVLGRWNETYSDEEISRAEDLLAKFGVADLAERRFGTLSSGEAKRVQLARALLTRPEILILDEPAAGLDLRGREELVASLTQLSRDPAAPTMVLVTHHVEEIPPGFTHLLLMGQHGSVVAQGPIQNTLTAANLTAAFGAPLSATYQAGRWQARAQLP